MKIIGICGSPRKKNTYFMMGKVIESAKENGAEAELISLADINLERCTGCIACEKTKECVISDDMKEIIPKLKDADVIVLGSPSYYNNVTGLMKDFIDRTNPLWEGMELKGKKAAIVCTGAQEIMIVQKCTDVMIDFCKIVEMEVIGSVTANDQHLDSEAVINECKKLGETIANS